MARIAIHEEGLRNRRTRILVGPREGLEALRDRILATRREDPDPDTCYFDGAGELGPRPDELTDLLAGVDAIDIWSR